jgi:ferredoxin--NADP+ reductase
MERTHTILEKRQLSENVFCLRVNAPLISRERKAGQFILLSIDGEFGERIPLTIADADAEEGSITLIFQRVGLTTTRLAQMEVGDALAVLVGPLGQPTHIENVGTVVCVGGGIGVAPLHPIVQALKAAGNRIVTIIGARSKELIILEDEMRALSDELIVCTDDGSYGRKALVTEPLKETCENENPALAVAIGPPIMMKFCAETTRPFGVHTVVSLNTIMVDGTGMCGGCRVNVGGKAKFVCVDGPEFDGHEVDFDEMMQRLRAYQPQERQAMADYEAHGECNLDKAYREATEKKN